MKINEVNTNAIGVKSKKIRRGDNSGFADLLSAGDSIAMETDAGQVVTAAPVDGVSALLSLQEISPEENNRKHIMQQGKTSLDILDNLRREILLGNIDPATINRMQHQLAALKQSKASDNKLQAIIDDIELRLAVEVAKLEKL